MTCEQFTIDGVVFDCPVEIFTHIFNDKNKLFLAWLLHEKSLRFSQIAEQCHWISEKTLSAKLKQLEAQHIIIRTVYPEVPPRVEYTLSEDGQALQPVFETLYAWGCNYGNRHGEVPS